VFVGAAVGIAPPMRAALFSAAAPATSGALELLQPQTDPPPMRELPMPVGPERPDRYTARVPLGAWTPPVLELRPIPEPAPGAAPPVTPSTAPDPARVLVTGGPGTAPPGSGPSALVWVAGGAAVAALLWLLAGDAPPER
jgi:hypothetical protein